MDDIMNYLETERNDVLDLVPEGSELGISGNAYTGRYTITLDGKNIGSVAPSKFLGDISDDIKSLLKKWFEDDVVNHPSHYCQEGSMECIDEMILLFGIEETMSFCKLNAWKYRKRALYKNGKEDMKKSDWYINKYDELKDILEEQVV